MVSDISMVTPASFANYRSALDPSVESLLNKIFAEEMRNGRFSKQDYSLLRIQAIGAAPKKDSNMPRTITDCSRPFVTSFSSFIETHAFGSKPYMMWLSLARPIFFCGD